MSGQPPLAASAGLERVTAWFHGRKWTPFEFQRRVWQAYRQGQSGLIHATTGTGKTFAAFLGAVAEWIDEQSRRDSLAP